MLGPSISGNLDVRSTPDALCQMQAGFTAHVTIFIETQDRALSVTPPVHLLADAL